MESASLWRHEGTRIRREPEGFVGLRCAPQYTSNEYYNLCASALVMFGGKQPVCVLGGSSVNVDSALERHQKECIGFGQRARRMLEKIRVSWRRMKH
jgi:hypothetical protein